MSRGLFVTLEGIEGSGKSTLLTPIKNHFENQGKKVLITREPGGTDLGNALRTIILHFEKESVCPLAELLLIQAARAQHIEHVVIDALKNYDLVVCDRFTLSTLAYQWGGRGIEKEAIISLNELATHGIEPDITILLDLTTQTALERRKKRLIQHDRFETEDLTFHEKVRQAYLSLAKTNSKQIRVFDSSVSSSELRKSVIQVIHAELDAHG
ncbi:MAG: dTMP kinase [Bdellovibrionales bacterium]|nr:dTMP kinase [Bdellovibrionales bacterium]